MDNKLKTPKKFNNNYTNMSNSGSYLNNNNPEIKSSENSPRPLMISNKLASKVSKSPSTPTSNNNYNFPRESAESSYLTKSISEINVNLINRLLNYLDMTRVLKPLLNLIFK